jgi:UDP-N-acetylglucosamine--N-acetylmuramyl-(pentapeptide) pyrophosphoryl-undecaprenol N-acetylglucosamine transferase
MMIKDNEAMDKLVPSIIALAKDEHKLAAFKTNISGFAINNADDVIAKDILSII